MTPILKKNKSNENLIDDYMRNITTKCENIMPIVKNPMKINSDNIIIPTIENYNDISKYNYNLSQLKNIIILCGHYKGVDERVREHLITREISIGNYVLSGGELAAAVIADSIIRIIPGAISDETSALSDSFQDNLLAPPVYTRPAEFNGWKVPDILLSGHQANIDNWRHEQSIERTKQRRPEL